MDVKELVLKVKVVVVENWQPVVLGVVLGVLVNHCGLL
jgi:hypothetical protein